MSNAPSRAADALSLPVIAYRGLWDKFGKPLSDEAIRRSYLRGVPSLVRCGDESAVHDVLELVRKSTASGRTPTVYLQVDGLPSMTARPIVDASVDIFAIDVEGVRGRVSTIYQWLNDGWTKVGRYIPFAASVHRLTAADLTSDCDRISLVLFESANVVTDVRHSFSTNSVDDDAIYGSILSFVGATAEVARVSDLVELDLLNQRIREAA